MPPRQPPRFLSSVLVLFLVGLVGSAVSSAVPAHGHGEVTTTKGLQPGDRDFDQLHLEIHVEPDLQRGTVRGRVTLGFEALRDGLERLRLHAEDMRILAIAAEDGTALTWTHEKGVLAIDLPRRLERGDATAVTIAYRSTPRRGLYFHRPTKRHPTTPLFLYSQGQSNDNRRWIPCYDLPDDRFAWDLHVTVPETLTTVSNGTLVASTDEDDGRRSDHWRFEDRSPSYLISLIAAPLETITTSWENVTLEYSAVPGRREELEVALRETPRMMAFFSDFTGRPYPWKRYAQTFVWDFVYGGMENVTATTLNMRALHRESARPNYRSEGLVAHELAHMWFGDLLTCRTWDDIWLNEGFATYLTDLYFEHRHGQDEFLLRRRRQNDGYMDGTPNASGLKLERNPRGDRPLELFGGKQYNRGAAILHMLRLELGDELFGQAVQAYVTRHDDEAVCSEDLRRTVEDVSGRDLEWFWNQWVYGAGYPVLDVRWKASDRTLTVRQVQERKNGVGLFRLTLPVRIGPRGEVKKLRIWRDHHTFTIPGDEAAARVGVGGDLLARIRLEQPDAAWIQLLQQDPDVTGRLDAVEVLERRGENAVKPLARAGVTDASWAVRQAAVEALAVMDHDRTALEVIHGAAMDMDPRVRESALEALGARRRDEAGGIAAAMLKKAAREETHDYPKAAAAQSLGRVKVQGAFETLRGLLDLESHGDVVRAGALRGLAALGDPRGAALARPYCDYAWGRGGAHRMREAALECVLALEPDAEGTHALLEALLKDPFHRMRQKAAHACGTYGVQEARRTLEALAKHDWNEGVKRAAGEALKRLSGK